MRPILKGSTDQSVVIRIVDSGDGTPETGVVYNTSGIDLWYRREGATKTSITEATLSALNDAHSDGGILHIGDGYYRIDLPDAAVASGANGVTVGGTVTGMVVIGCYVPLIDVNLYDGVRAGLTALPNAAADAAGGLVISDAGGLDIDARLAKLADAGFTAATFNSDNNVYVAKPFFLVNAAGSVDEYGCGWVKNGVDLTAGVTVPKMTAYLRSDASVLINDQDMTAITATPGFKYQALTTERASLAGVLMKFTATIDGATRTSWWWAGRDR